MISTNTYIAHDRTPYTYLIRWNQLDLNYYGRRTAKDCHPEEFFISYFTSSKYVSDIIAEYGMPDVIKIHRIFSDVDSCKLQEERFLKRVNAAKSLNWINQTNGDKNFDTTGIAAIKYPDTIIKHKKTCLTKYGFEYPMQNPVTKEKAKQTWLEKYGFDHPAQDPFIKEKNATTRRNSLLKLFGCTSEQEIIENIFYYEKLYNIKRRSRCNPNLQIILKYFPVTAHKSIKGLRTIFKNFKY